MNYRKKALKILSKVSEKRISREERVAHALNLTEYLIRMSFHKMSIKEKRRERNIAKMIADPKGKAFLTEFTDQSARSINPQRTVDQMHYLIQKWGIPKFLDDKMRLYFLLFFLLGKTFPLFFSKQMKRKIRQEMSQVFLPFDEEKRKLYFREAKKENIQINLNHLGEAILGEGEAKKRLSHYIETLKKPEIEYISVKISTIYSQINLIDAENTLEALAERLRLLYREAKEKEKFVNLDMEEYKDLELTISLFQKVLDEPEFFWFSAGIALQAYLPDSFGAQKKLTLWAKKRVEKGGAPIKIRIVKGANLAMEKVESSIKGWTNPVFENKTLTDANFKRMIEYAIEHLDCVHIGVASHNLFDISYALLLRSEYRGECKMGIEMLEGMAAPMRRAVSELSSNMLLYCPETHEKNFQNAVAYLIRRLDENTGKENFLSHFFRMKPKNKAWDEEEERFLNAFDLIDHLPSTSKREQNRNLELYPNNLKNWNFGCAKAPGLSDQKSVNISNIDRLLIAQSREFSLQPKSNSSSCLGIKEKTKQSFSNESDTDFSREENRKWAAQILEEWKNRSLQSLPMQNDPFALVEFAKDEEKIWGNTSFGERTSILERAAHLFRKNRKELIGSMITDTGKNISEADAEVSEAIDFIEYYILSADSFYAFKDLKFSPKGTILITPPWNFPCSIPTSGIAAALVCGNCVLFKPAPEAILVGWTLVNLFWQAGISKKVLQFLNIGEAETGNELIKNSGIDAIILTGSAKTARHFLNLRPGLDLSAETGGKNAIIVTAMADRDLAIRDIIQSAFSHSGQKCSACSLVILEKEVYEDPHFLSQLKDAAESLCVSSAWDLSAKVTPLIRSPEGPLKRALTSLEEGESWLLKPKEHTPHLWSPGIKIDVQKGSFTHLTEFFGPLLGIMKANNLEEAISFANGTPYGLTSGLHSLDEREHDKWKRNILAGNLYINRSITGAIVRRQPFGGCKESHFGPGTKAGGPNYVLFFSKIADASLPNGKGNIPKEVMPLFSLLSELSENERKIFKRSVENYAYWAPLLKEPKDESHILGQHNFFYLVPRETAYLWGGEKNLLALLQVAAACLICQTPLEFSAPFSFKIEGVICREEEEEAYLERMKGDRIRVIGSVSEKMRRKAAGVGTILENSPILSNGRIELLHYLREVSLSIDYHRYGYLG